VVPQLVRRTFSIENAISNGIWGGVYALLYAALAALVPVFLHAVTQLTWPWLVVVGFATFCLLSAGTLALWARKRQSASPLRNAVTLDEPEGDTQHRPSPAKARPRRATNSQKSLDDLYVEGRQMFEASAPFAAETLIGAMKGPAPTDPAIDRWEGKVRAALPKAHRRRFRFGPLDAKARKSPMAAYATPFSLESDQRKRLRESLDELQRIMDELDEG
jgi:hypothetical protein